MKELEKKIKELMDSGVGIQARKRIQEFSAFKNHSEKKWFSELCFCLLTANTSAEMGLRVQKKVSAEKFLSLSEKKLSLELKKAGSRFYNRRANFIYSARNLKVKKELKKISSDKQRAFLADNVKGFGLKEASHFLRNTGCFDYAIIDKHVFNVSREFNLIKTEKLNKKTYFELEKKLLKLAGKLGISLGELDLYLWFMKTGKILK